jgi:hypothetical protein
LHFCSFCKPTFSWATREWDALYNESRNTQNIPHASKTGAWYILYCCHVCHCLWTEFGLVIGFIRHFTAQKFVAELYRDRDALMFISHTIFLHFHCVIGYCHQTELHIMVAMKLKLKLIYDRQSVDQCVPAPGTHPGPATNISSSLKPFSDSCEFTTL